MNDFRRPRDCRTSCGHGRRTVLAALSARSGRNTVGQVRMLRDRNHDPSENFVVSGSRLVAEEFTPDPAQFPGFDESLRARNDRETELFFDAVCE